MSLQLNRVSNKENSLTVVGLLRLRPEKCSITSQFDFLGAGVSAGEGEVPLGAEAEGVLRPESSVRTGAADERSDAQRRPRIGSCVNQ